MDFLERLNRRFGSWYEGLFGAGAAERELRPRDILRRILAAMEDNRREGLDGGIYVPNDYTLVLASQNEEERDYLRAFLGAEDLTSAVRRAMEQHGYRAKGGLRFTIEEAPVDPAADEARVQIRCRFDASIPDAGSPPAVSSAPPPPQERSSAAAVGRRTVPAPLPKVVPAPDHREEDSEPGTVPAFAHAVLATLIVRSADGRVLEAFPLTAAGVRIGRSRQGGNDIVLSDDVMVSKRHAVIRAEHQQQGAFRLFDEGSTNGTFVNSEPVPPRDGHALAYGDEIRLGETTIIFKPVNAAAASAPLPAASHAPAAEASEHAGFRLVSSDGGGDRIPLASSMSLGRSPTSDIVLEGEGVANTHARLTQKDGVVYVEDLNAPAGTFVNGERIPARFPVALYEGDEVGFGGRTLSVQRTTRGRTARG